MPTIKKRRKWTAPGQEKYNLGEPIKDLNVLYKMAIDKKAVYCTNLRRHYPVAALIHMQMMTVISWMSKDWIVEIIKTKNNEQRQEKQ